MKKTNGFILRLADMKCNCCIARVHEVFKKLKIVVVKIDLDSVSLRAKVSPSKMKKLEAALKKTGHEILFSRAEIMIRNVVLQISKLINEIEIGEILLTNKGKRFHITGYLKSKIDYDYDYLSSRFADATGDSVIHYYITQKIERAKVLIEMGYSIKEVSIKLQYGRPSQFSKQFLDVTLMKASDYRKSIEKRLKKH